ncbi:transposase [Acetobacter estunensis NRIC 0472]|uniref:DDE-type integrase/transposase/recombinase n=1 Tax=Acetobacter estunensis TaxID=104097 RepID=A0A967BEW9_9PROT|nr:transposase domain-containing protein [Acetobacter estunensis]NHO55262.1 DDE-type integrase/transposase/recombinase [Acetobacter estunensis]GBQ27194.1 transposase [Acetobacter estunensis NRIC 0472]
MGGAQTAAEQVPWMTAAEIAAQALPGMPGTKRGVQERIDSEGWLAPDREGQTWRKRSGRGGGYEFTPYSLPLEARAALLLRREQEQSPEAKSAAFERSREDLWRRYEGLPDNLKARAQRAFRILDAIETLVLAGTRKNAAVCQVAQLERVGRRTIMGWYQAVRGFDRGDWLPALAPQYAGRQPTSDCPPEAWEMLKSDYLRVEQPRFSDCYRRLEREAEARGWSLPSEKTLKRRMDRLDPQLIVLAREGVDALKALYPVQKRDRRCFHALEAVNADGHKWDVFVKWEDGNIGRPVMTAFQDLYSGMILSWRVDRSENKEAVRLAFGDMVEEFGIPDHCWLDNGRNFASKWLTGGVENRFRFRIRDDEPVGIMTQMGVQVHWTTPYSGQSKPIERAFRDMAQNVAKHPAFAGAWTGNTPLAKPENYASTAVPIDVFLKTITTEIREHNARTGRRTAVCGGKLSFQQAFAASYAVSPIRKATSEQRRLWLLAAEAIKVDRRDGTIKLLENRYWADFLLDHRGQSVVVRFDPQNLQADLHVYRTCGTYLGAAPCHEAVGFADVDAARRHGQARRAFMRATREALAAEKSLSAQEMAAVYSREIEAENTEIETKVVRPFRPAVQGNTALAVEMDEAALIAREEEEQAQTAALRKVIQFSRTG